MNDVQELIYALLIFFVGSGWLAVLFWLLGRDDADQLFKHIHTFSVTLFCFYVVMNTNDTAARITSLLILPLISPVISQFVFQVTKSGVEVVKKKLKNTDHPGEISEIKRIEARKEEVR